MLNANEWNIQRAGRPWDRDEFWGRYQMTPEKFEATDGKLFLHDDQRLTVLALLLENMGADAAVRLGDPAVWRAAIAALDS